MSEPSECDPLVKLGGIIAAAGILSGLLTILIDPVSVSGMGGMAGPGGMGTGMAGRVELSPFVDVQMFLSTFNVILLVVLGGIYLGVYRDIPNRFTLSLLLFSGALLLYALASNPIVHIVFGYGRGPGLGPFAFLPDLFAAAAIVFLMYQSLQ